MASNQHRQNLEKIYQSAVAAVHPSALMPRVLSIHEERLQIGEKVLPLQTFDKIYVSGAGKASGAMAVEAEKVLGELIAEGVVAVKDLPSQNLKYIRLIVAGHPTPDRNSVIAAEEIMELVQKIKKNDLLIFLLSGGASSLITDIPECCSLQEMNHFYAALVNSGASISEINTVRKHLSQIKGGKLARLCKGQIVTFIISDVPGNDLSVIGSGPTAADFTTFTDALSVLKKYQLLQTAPPGVKQYFLEGSEKVALTDPYSDEKEGSRCEHYIIGDIHRAIEAAGNMAEQLGYTTTIRPELLTDQTEKAAEEFVRQVLELNDGKKNCIIAGGETTLSVQGTGMGGRNQHFALMSTLLLHSHPNIALLSAGTDGTDGPTDAAGAFATSDIYHTALNRQIDPRSYLSNFNSYNFFRATDGHFFTGATDTNVMDLVIALVN